jgi:hypothetical protein
LKCAKTEKTSKPLLTPVNNDGGTATRRREFCSFDPENRTGWRVCPTI